MTLREELIKILEAGLSETTGVYVNAGVDAEAYYSGLAIPPIPHRNLRWILFQSRRLID